MNGRARSLLDRLLARHRAAATDAPTDADLLARFARDRDPAAFELLVWRHGGAVLGVCRRTLCDEHAAEDAFQAVFLVLARKAGAVRGNLGGWLFKVARRVAARAAARRPAVCEVRDALAPHAPDAAERAELLAVLDAEIARLPERLRAAVVLCYLGDHSTEAAARELGCPRGTVLSRLSAARAKLAARLARRGVTLPAALAVPVLGAPLVSSASASARDAALAVPNVSLLATEVLRAMNRTSALAALGGVALVLVTGAGLLTARGGGDGDNPPPPATKLAPPAARPDGRAAREDEIKKLERAAESLRSEIEANEKAIQLMGKSASNATQFALLTKRQADLDAETAQLGREVTKLQVEVAVLKKLLAEKSAAPEARVVDELAQRDGELQRVKDALRKAKDSFEIARGTADKDTPIVRELRADIVRLEQRYAERFAEARKEALESARDRATATTRARIEQAETDLSIKTKVLDHFKTERDALAKQLGTNAESATSIDRMNAALAPQREMLTQLLNQIARLRLEAQGVRVLPPVPAPAASDDKLDRILRELAELRKDVQELKLKRK